MLGNILDSALVAPGLLVCLLLYNALASYLPLRKIPGPLSFALSKYRLAYEAWQTRRCRAIHGLHENYGPIVRVTPNEISFNSLSALRTIYGAGSGFEKTSFYSMFDVYGRPNLFSFGPVQAHRERKKLLSHAYSNQMILNSYNTTLVESKVAQLIRFLESEPVIASETFTSLHYFSFDTISEFVYGPQHGGTKALVGSFEDRALLHDILNPSRRRLAWFAVHFPTYTKFITTRAGILGRIITWAGLLPMSRPFVYSGIRSHALAAFHSMKSAGPDICKQYSETTVLGRLLHLQHSRPELGLSDLDIASECADHLLAGIDTTSDSSMFLIWALSLPKNKVYQLRLRDEILANLPSDPKAPIPGVKAASQLPYLNAVIKETLRLYAPLPTSEPRSSPSATIIDDYAIPAGTIVGMSPYSLHRNPIAYPDPLKFNPDRWLEPFSGSTAPHSSITSKTTDKPPSYIPLPPSTPQNEYFWSFSSGPRKCIGLHLAMAELTCLTAAIYSKFETKVREEDRWGRGPGITSRFEVFWGREDGVEEEDHKAENCEGGKGEKAGGGGIGEHRCWIDFRELTTQ